MRRTRTVTPKLLDRPRRPAIAITIAIAALLLLGGCLPGTAGAPGLPKVALINGPAETRLPGLAETLERQAGTAPAAVGFAWAAPAQVRFLEVRRNLFFRRSVNEAARLARAVGAQAALMIGAPTFTREVNQLTTLAGPRQQVIITVGVRLLLIDAESEVVVNELSSDLFSASRLEPTTTVLPPPEEDPALPGLLETAVADVLPLTLGAITDFLAARQAPVGE